jgi:hypothetical protein
MKLTIINKQLPVNNKIQTGFFVEWDYDLSDSISFGPFDSIEYIKENKKEIQCLIDAQMGGPPDQWNVYKAFYIQEGDHVWVMQKARALQNVEEK